MLETMSAIGGKPRQMGKVYARVTVTNLVDEGMAKRGFLRQDEIRSVTMESVLVDTGATTLCLPQELFGALRADTVEDVMVETAVGVTTARIARGVSLTVEGRTRTVDCLELPGGRQPLLGVFPLEILGIELDLKNERLRLLPEWGPETHLTIL